MRQLFDVKEDEVALYPDGKDSDAGAIRRVGDAGVEVEGPGMPGADDGLPFDPTLAERALAMRTEVIERAEFAVDAGEADGQALHVGLEELAFAWRLIGGA